jgi:hypothetical protein
MISIDLTGTFHLEKELAKIKQLGFDNNDFWSYELYTKFTNEPAQFMRLNALLLALLGDFSFEVSAPSGSKQEEILWRVLTELQYNRSLEGVLCSETIDKCLQDRFSIWFDMDHWRGFLYIANDACRIGAYIMPINIRNAFEVTRIAKYTYKNYSNQIPLAKMSKLDKSVNINWFEHIMAIVLGVEDNELPKNLSYSDWQALVDLKLLDQVY